MQEVQANTQVKVRVGPAMAVADAVTPVTTLALGAADEAELLKHDGAATVDISGNTFAAVTSCDGWYDLTLTTGNLDTEGQLTIVIQDADLCMPIWKDIMVLSQAAYASKYGAQDSGKMQVELADDAITSAKYDESTAFPVKSADTGATQIARVGADGDTLETLSDQIDTAQADLDLITGADGATLATAQGNYAPAKAGDNMNLADDAITSAKFDESTAYPLASADTGSTEVARTGADSDTLEVISDEIDAVSAQISGITNAGAAVNTAATSYTLTTGTQSSGTYTSTQALDGTNHEHTDDTGSMDLYYEFLIGSGSPSSVKFTGYLQGINDNLEVYGYDWIATGWVQIGTLAGQVAASNVVNSYDLTTAMVGTGADKGKVRVRFTDGAYTLTSATLAIDQLLLAFNIGAGGYADGIEVDTNESNTNTVPGVDGVKGNPVSTWAAALTLSAATNIKEFYLHNGSSITLTADSSSYTIKADGLFTLNMGSQTVTNIYVNNAILTGTGNGTGAVMEDCSIANSTAIPSGYYVRCGIAAASGTPMTATTAGEYTFVDCVSTIAGSATPYMDFSGLGSSSGVNIRRWSGGSNITLDSDNTLSLEVVTGGGQTVTTGGANVEIRGCCRAVTVAMSAAETVQFAGVTGPIALSGTTTGTVNLFGVAGDLTDTTSGATVTNKTVSRENINTEADTALSDYGANTTVPDAAGTAAGLHSTTDGLINALNDLSAADVNAQCDIALSDYGAAVPGDAMTLSDDAITSAKFDESTAYPLKSADAGSTQVARTGADGDTLETISDEIAAIGGDASAANQTTIINHLTDVKGTGFVKDTNSLVNLSGGTTVTWTIQATVS